MNWRFHIPFAVVVILLIIYAENITNFIFYKTHQPITSASALTSPSRMPSPSILQPRGPLSYLTLVSLSLQDITEPLRGAYIFHVSPQTGFEYRSRVAHTAESRQLSDRSFNIRRSAFINDTLFTISDHMIASHRLGDLMQIGSVAL